MVRAMKKKIKIIELLSKIANDEEVPKYVEYKDRIDNRFKKMMVCKENLIYKLDQLEIELNDEVKIIDDEEDKDIPLIPDDELWVIGGISRAEQINYNFKVLKDKINQVVEEFNEYRKEKE